MLEDDKMRTFFNITDHKIYVIEKPIYKTGLKGETTYRTKYTYLQEKMR
jgi:hypothetical protein